MDLEDQRGLVGAYARAITGQGPEENKIDSEGKNGTSFERGLLAELRIDGFELNQEYPELVHCMPGRHAEDYEESQSAKRSAKRGVMVMADPQDRALAEMGVLRRRMRQANEGLAVRRQGPGS